MRFVYCNTYRKKSWVEYIVWFAWRRINKESFDKLRAYLLP